MSFSVALIVALFLAMVPAFNVTRNLLLYRPTPPYRGPRRTSSLRASILIPARNEEEKILSAIEGARNNRDVDLEILVMDDHSTDRTAEIVSQIAAEDPRVRLVLAPTLPNGWCGKQHACYRLAEASDGDFLIFVDADVVLDGEAVGRMIEFMQRKEVDLASGVPLQKTGSLLEKLVVPLIHFILLGYLPMARMRRRQSAAYAAGCGQLFVARREAYFRAGGHAGIRASRHDGLMLPRLFRQAGLHTDLFDATDIAACRMYRSNQEVWEGFAKNATEGMAKPGAILPWSLILAGGQIAPLALAYLAVANSANGSIHYVLLALTLVYGARIALAVRFRQSVLGVVLHPVGVLTVLLIQWFALGRSWLGVPLAWKGRT